MSQYPQEIAAHLTALSDAGDDHALWAAVSAPELLARAMGEREVAEIVLPALGALAWSTPAASAAGERFRLLPPAMGLEPLVTRVGQQITMAGRFGLLRNSGALMPPPADVPAPLVELFADELFASPARRTRTFARLRPLLDDPDVVLGFCDRLAAADLWMAATLIERLRWRSPRWSDHALDRVPADVVHALELALGEVHDPGRTPRLIVYGSGGAVALAASVAGYVWSGMTLNPGTLVSAALIIGGERFYKGGVKRRYPTRIRPHLARILARIGVQADCINAVAAASVPRLKTYDRQLRDDVGLALFGAIAALVREAEGESPTSSASVAPTGPAPG